MRLVGLEPLVSQLDKEENWLQTLTRGEQQRLGVARLLINRPQWIFVQEAFDSLKPEDEEQMLQLIREQLPNAAWLIISHSLEKSDFYTSRLSL
jgi:putative ATP-binding cassette transporter